MAFSGGDMWELEFVPAPPWHLPSTKNVLPLDHASCAALFSGGLDSAIGALDILKDGQRPVLVSHAYPKDASRQSAVMANLPPGYHHLAFNADPRCTDVKHDVSMRTRSFNFLAVGAAVADAIARTTDVASVDLLVPENGFIALNPPLTPVAWEATAPERRIRTSCPFTKQSWTVLEAGRTSETLTMPRPRAR